MLSELLYNFLLFYPAVGRNKVGPVEHVLAKDLDDIVYNQVASGLVTVIRQVAYAERYSLGISSEELCHNKASNEFYWKDVKELP